MPEPLDNPRFLLETAWRRIAELETQVRQLTAVAVDNERLVKAHVDLEESLIRLNKLLDELTLENARLRCERKEKTLSSWQVSPSEDQA